MRALRAASRSRAARARHTPVSVLGQLRLSAETRGRAPRRSRSSRRCGGSRARRDGGGRSGGGTRSRRGKTPGRCNQRARHTGRRDTQRGKLEASATSAERLNVGRGSALHASHPGALVRPAHATTRTIARTTIERSMPEVRAPGTAHRYPLRPVVRLRVGHHGIGTSCARRVTYEVHEDTSFLGTTLAAPMALALEHSRARSVRRRCRGGRARHRRTRVATSPPST